MRLLWAAAAAASVLLLAGCTSVFAPDPTATPTRSSAPVAADVPCTIANSTISAGDPSASATSVLTIVMANFADFDASGQVGEEFSPEIDGSGVIEVNPTNAFDSLQGTHAEWQTAVLNAIHSLGTLPRNLGIVPGAIAAQYDEPFAEPSARSAVWGRGYVARTAIVPFTVRCPGGFDLHGTLTTFDPNHATNLVFECDGRHHANDSQPKAFLRDVCNTSGVGSGGPVG